MITRKYLILRRYFYKTMTGLDLDYNRSLFIIRFDHIVYKTYRSIQKFRRLYSGRTFGNLYRVLVVHTDY